MCSILEDEMELPLSDFLEVMMEQQHENVYFSLMTKKRLQEKYKDKISFDATSGKVTPVALLQKHGIINEKVSETDDAEGIMKTTAKLRPIFILQ